MRYQKTHSDDIPELTRLWKQAFGDSDEDIARFFRDLFPAATGFAARDGERLAAMCFALPQQLSCGDTVQRISTPWRPMKAIADRVCAARCWPLQKRS